MRGPALLLTVMLFGCHKEASQPPFDGHLTIKQVMATPWDKIPLCEDTWDVALGKLQKTLGPPQKIENDQFVWAVIEGDQCAQFRVWRGECPASWGKPGLRLESTGQPVTTSGTHENKIGNHSSCVEAAHGSS